MVHFDRRAFLKVSAGAVAAAGVTGNLGVGAARAQGGSFKFKLGTDLPVAHPVNVRLREAIDAIAAETNGAVAITLFPNNQLGSDSDMMSQIRSGALELATFPGTVLSTLIPSTSLTGLGFAFTSYDKVWAAMDGEVGNYIRQNIGKANLHAFDAVWDNGFRQITTSNRPIQTPDDLKNLKIRVPVVPLWVSMFTALGASPVSIPLSDAYSSLQTKIADAQENPLVLIDFAKFYEVQKYCSLTNHAWDGFWMLASGRIWRGVPADVQQVMAKHLNAAALKERDDVAKATVDLQKSLEGKGLVFNKVDVDAFQKALSGTGFYGQWKDKFGADAWTLVQKYAGNIG
ncbi:ABC transporter substrate-binding protein [Skermanella aerolata]|uniref:ABC transporter substrate-binding protein n=1 Tax=Skermanella aerolata TaxID=393310 RepID=A0A512DRM8_9PROT|nr:TRAP transporter substrate-binding protein [Skermanella aerolata]KJB93145.1 ABC transporter substrate-binding protein [Skermanella aerolata KACC 11604]GEO39097.1 ABC transporter substrate-binding protein [Skermanella aerolata]